VNVNAWIQNVKAAAHAIASYAVDLGGVPRVSTKKRLAKKGLNYKERRNVQARAVM
jgi:hypothetical protein